MREHADVRAQPLPDPAAGDLARDLIALLRKSPGQAAALDALLLNPRPQHYDGGITSVSLLLAAPFLPRTRFRFKRRFDGKWEAEIEHEPADSKLLTSLIERITARLSGGSSTPPGP